MAGRDDNRWSRRADLAGEMIPPRLERRPTTAIDRDSEYAVTARALGRAYRRSGGKITPEIRAGLAALAAMG